MPGPDTSINLRAATVLTADENQSGLDILGQILMGFGVQRVIRAQTPDEFRRHVETHHIDLVILDSNLGGGMGYELVHWLRRLPAEPKRFTPAIVLAGYTPLSQVEQARDCGASFMVAKPISANVLLDRIVWIGRSARPFVEAPAYVGPDRRFKNEGVPLGAAGRRSGDLSGDLGEAVQPNLSQSEIDDLMTPKRMIL
jgi:CheY-like chemotaxis protein